MTNINIIILLFQQVTIIIIWPKKSQNKNSCIFWVYFAEIPCLFQKSQIIAKTVVQYDRIFWFIQNNIPYWGFFEIYRKYWFKDFTIFCKAYFEKALLWPPNKRSIIPLWVIFNLIYKDFRKRLSLWLLRHGPWLIPGWDTSVSLSLVDIWVNRLVRLIQSYIYISADLGDPVNPLFDTFGAPVCSQRFGCGIIYSLVQSFAFCQCNLVLVPRTHNALLSIKLLCWENITNGSYASHLHHSINNNRKWYKTYLDFSTLQWATWVCWKKESGPNHGFMR